MIFWKRSGFIDSVRHSAGCNYFFYLKALRIFFSRGSAVEGSGHFFHTVHSSWLSPGNTQEIKWLWKTLPWPGQRHEVTETEWEISKPAASVFWLPLSAFLVQEGKKNKAGELTDVLC